MKKEEAHARYLHSSSQRQGRSGSPGSSAVGGAGAAAGGAADDTAAAGEGRDGEAANRASGPATLPEVRLIYFHTPGDIYTIRRRIYTLYSECMNIYKYILCIL